jgi:hypothetical protein
MDGMCSDGRIYAPHFLALGDSRSVKISAERSVYAGEFSYTVNRTKKTRSSFPMRWTYDSSLDKFENKLSDASSETNDDSLSKAPDISRPHVQSSPLEHTSNAGQPGGASICQQDLGVITKNEHSTT